ncbi:hypothetical protein JOQ06_021602 [Pogonophryne albipinna]|uniref:CCHC-type domain-containing protein n=1 Tax=Pogonophryne albipinna TaxID=1090488 RepID=A0AAD6AF35_9TELE|nr:hypothetical protein JOQ06_021602 [Pogonophryne albipinna]
MAGRADDGQPIPRVGLRFTLRFQAVDAAEDVVSRTWFCRKVIMEQLNLKVDAIYCLQWNQQEKAFDVTLKDEQVYTKVAKDCVAAAMLKPLACYKVLNLDRPNFRTITVHMFNPFVTDKALADFLRLYGEVLTAARRVKDTMGIWTGRRQFQVLLKSDPESFGGLKHPPCLLQPWSRSRVPILPAPASFLQAMQAIGPCGWRVQRRKLPVLWPKGHEAKDCTVPKACHGCGGIDHLYRSCPERKRTFAEVAGAKTRRKRSSRTFWKGFSKCQKAMFPESTGETVTVEQGPGGGSGADSVDKGPVGNTDSTVAADVGVKTGARKIEEAFGTEASADNGDCSQIGNNKREWTKGDSIWSVGGVHSTGVGILFCYKE